LEELLPVLPKRAKALVVIGETAPKFEKLFKDKMTVKRVETLKEAVRAAFQLAKPNGTVLFSPGCASFDMFKNYADRGKRFVEEVLSLKEELQ
jgi:UDP-N-acetylmuramoylalanine--D-glutamate ligase